MRPELVEVKIFQTARGNPEKRTLKGTRHHVSRFMYIICWIKREDECDRISQDGNYYTKFVDKFCPFFEQQFPAVILDRVVPPDAMSGITRRYEEYTQTHTTEYPDRDNIGAN